MSILPPLSSRFADLGSAFSQAVLPEPVIKPQLVSVNQNVAKQLNLSLEELHSDVFLHLLAGHLPQGAQSTASVYSGHQFGHYNPQLGDGRAVLWGDYFDQHGKAWELQVKGSGITPYSRFGDGRAVLRSSIREYLCSAAMQALGIPTTTALALITSETPVQREQIEQAAVVLRVAPSFIRFGHFAYFFYQQKHQELKQLADFVIEHYYPDCKGNYANWFEQIVLRTAEMIAQWQAVGFCHGVMNTDNMSILGLTIDYGPFAFMDEFDPQFICNHSDTHGRYSYQNQPNIGLWNLNALAHALSPLIATEQLQASLALYAEHLQQHYHCLMLEKLGLRNQQGEAFEQLLSKLFAYLTTHRVDYPSFFSKLSNTTFDQLAKLDNTPAYNEFFSQYTACLTLQSICDADRLSSMQLANPHFILRNYFMQQAIEQAEKGDYQTVNDWLKVLSEPFKQHQGLEHLADEPAFFNRHLVLSCSS